jgi:hypothetical protein
MPPVPLCYAPLLLTVSLYHTGLSSNLNIDSLIEVTVELNIRFPFPSCLQLNCTDEDVIVGAVSIFKAIMLKPNHSQEDALINSRQANIVIPFLLHLLDEQDGTSRAVVMLIAEYCSL